MNILGLEVAERHRGAIHFKSDSRYHTLCYFEGDPDDQVTAFEVAGRSELQAAAATLEQLGHAVHSGTAEECATRHVREFIRFTDPTGNGIELVVRPEHSRPSAITAPATPASPASATSACAPRMPPATRSSGPPSATPASPTGSAMRR